MPSPRGSRKSDAATLETCLAEVRAGKPAPVYLLDGDAFLSGRAARELATALVPESQRSLNLAELDAAASPAEVATELGTTGLFGGGKVVLVHEPAFLTSKEDGADAFERAREMWTDGRQREAARRLLALAAKAGWSVKDLAPEDGDPPGQAEWSRELGVEWKSGDDAFVRDAARFALERDMKAAKDDSSALDALLARGIPRGHVLVVAAGKVDGKLPLVKKLAAAGRRVTCAVERTGTWQDQRIELGPVVATLLAGTGKVVEPAARERLAELLGDDARALARELEKLTAYVGDRKTIRVEDVDEMVTRVASDPFFALGNAVEARDLRGALGVLDRSLADGASPFMILSNLASTFRRLVVEQERARAVAGDRPIRSPREWESVVYPTIPDEERLDKSGKPRHPFGFWKKYEAARRYTRRELLGALCALADVDLGLKSSGDERVLLERFLMTTVTTKTGSEV
ncbi:MAG TPA: DNA polymerase III subunit delta [Anaeromyxobacteraceae bacterium]|nr:DNA polymerase III subunit delta [Anaeromyxobacteraceae bacterium]